MPARSIWCSWKAALAQSHSSCEIAAAVASSSSAKCSRRVVLDAADGALGREELECEPDVVALGDRAHGDGRDVVPATWPHAQEPFGDETRQRVMHGTARHAELVGERVQAQLRARRLLAREDPRAELVVDALVEVDGGESDGHLCGT